MYKLCIYPVLFPLVLFTSSQCSGTNRLFKQFPRNSLSNNPCSFASYSSSLPYPKVNRYLGVIISSLTINPTGVNQVAEYDFAENVSENVPAGSYIAIQFPPQVTVPVTTTCTMGIGLNSGTGTCTLKGGNLLYVQNAVTSDVAPGYTIAIAILGIQNPPTTTATESIQITIYSSADAVIDSSTSESTLSIQATAGSLTATVTSNNNVVGGVSTWTWVVTLSDPVPQNGVITIYFPYWNNGMTSLSSQYLHYIRASTSCVGVQQLNASLVCSYVTSTNTLTISNGFASSTTGVISFTVQSIYNPPIGQSVSGFIVSSTDQSQGLIDQSSSVASPIPTTYNTINIAQYVMSRTPTTVQQSATYIIYIPITNPLSVGNQLQIDVPAQVSIVAGLTATASNCFIKNPTVSLGGQTIKFVNQVQNYCAPGSIVTLSITYLKNPSSTQPSSNFVARTMTSTSAPIDQGPIGTVTATPGTIVKFGSASFLTITNLSVGTTTTYQFEFSLPDVVPAGGAIQVTFPSDVTALTRASGSCTSVGMGISFSASCAVQSQVLTVTGGFATSFSGAVQFSINQITNPASAAPSGAFTISSYTDNTFTYMIDTVATITMTASPAALQGVSVAANSYVTGQSTTYTFTIQTTNTIPVGGSVQVTFPSGITINDVNAAIAGCIPVQNFQSAFSCSATSSSVTVYGFGGTPFPQGTLIFSITNVSNPPSTKLYQSFAVYTYTSGGSAIDGLSIGIGFQCKTANTFQQVTVTPASLTNAATTSYTFLATVRNQTPTGSYITVTPPSQVTFLSTVSCSAGATSCSWLAGTLTGSLSLSVAVTTGNTFSFTVSGIKNPGSTAPTDSFSLSSFTSDGYAIDQIANGVSVTTTIPASISSISISGSNTSVGGTASYTIAYTPIDPHPAGTSLTIVIPQQFTLAAITCTTVNLSLSLKCGTIGHSITVTDAFLTTVSPPSVIDVTISGLTNPGDIGPSSTWSILSSAGSYQIDQNNSIKSSFTCTSPCATCMTTAVTCQSCLAASSAPYFYSGDCHSGCQTGFTAISSTQCSACVSPCVTCSGSTSTCMSCTSPTPYLYNGTCNAACLTGYWGNGSICTACVNPCSACSSASVCTACTTVVGGADNGLSTYLYQGSCVLSCGSGYLPNSTSFNCDVCNSSCTTCSGNTNFCTGCTGVLKTMNGSCVGSCPADGTYIDTGSACIQCAPSCATCTGTVTTCLTCPSSAFLYNSSCLPQCPTSITITSGSMCKSCSSICATCAVSTTACTSCTSPDVLYKSQCIASCPLDTTVLVGSECFDCSSPCAKCSTAISTCTSCNAGMYLYQSQCLPSCPAGSTIPSTGACLSCDLSCQTCTGTVTTCKSCYEGMFLYKNACVSACPATLSITSGSNCLPCDSSCATCSGSTTVCMSCPVGMYLYGTQCVDGCPPAITLVSGSKCLPCSSLCLTCTGTTTTCSSCPTNNYIYQSQCFSQCPQGYAPSAGICEAIVYTDCVTGCSIAMLNDKLCQPVCNVVACNYDNGTCVAVNPVCIDGQYKNGTSCDQCQYPCNLCNSVTSCISCQTSTITSNLLLLNGDQCVDTCPDGKVKTGIICAACDSTCATCQGTVKTCITCQTGLYLYNNQCINACPQDVTVQIGNQCQDCVNCLTCSSSATTCTSCSSSQVLFSSTCRSICPDGYTLTSATGNVCQQCLSKCLNCSGSTAACTSCPSSSFLYLNDCVNSCPVSVTVTNQQQCVPCSTSCATCSGTLNACTACLTGTVLYNSICLPSCPNGYDNTNGVCTLTPPPTECATGCTAALLANSICDGACNNAACNNDNTKCLHVGSCPNGQYQQGTACVDCVYPCNFCQSSATCLSCSVVVGGANAGAQMFLYNGVCYETCPSGTMQNVVTCIACDSNCAECNGAVTTCIACSIGLFLYQGKCLNACPAGITVPQGQLCLACSINCATCSITFDNCATCSSGQVLNGGMCQSSCPTGTTTTSVSPTTCQTCTSPCQACSGSVTSCSSCIQGKVLWNATCVASCPALTTVLVGSTCTACQAPCVECQNSVTECTSCSATTSLFQNSCATDCPNGYESRLGVCTLLCADGCTSVLLQNNVCDAICNTASCNYDNSICNQPTNAPCVAGQYRDVTVCVNCVYPCNTCQTSAYCTSCLATKDGSNTQQYLSNGACVLTCPNGTYTFGIVCTACDSSCATCSGPSATECVSCPTSYKLYKGACQNSCPVGITIESSGVCLPCSSSCLTCTGAISTCASCVTGEVLSNGSCLLACPNGYTTTSTSQGNCLKCSGNCLTCLGAITTCTSCSSGVLSSGQCLSNCPAGSTTLTSDTTSCYACIQNCAECSSAIDHCTSCPTGQYVTSAFQCQAVVTCPTGETTTPTSAGICVPCTAPCQNCVNSTTSCTSCVQSFVLSGSTCSQCATLCKTCLGTPSACTACNMGYYLSGTQCLVCDLSCSSCDTTATNCTACDSTHILANGHCTPCDPSCLTCSGAITSCTSCSSPLFLVGSACQPCSATCKSCTISPSTCGSCNDGTFLQGSGCVACNNTCKTCSGTAQTCTSCLSSQLLMSDNTCVACVSSCKTCSGTSIHCTSCDPPKFLMNDNTCAACSTSCLTCSGSADTCTSCSVPLILISSLCQACDVSCGSCAGSVSTCVSCNSGAVLFNNKCLTTCPEGYYKNGNTCTQCSSVCLGCVSQPTNCISCPTGYALSGSVCIKSCPVGQYLSSNNCVNCSTNCVSCVDSYAKCTACSGSMVLNSQYQCEVPCANGYTRTATSNGVCLQCDSACTSCSGNTSYCTVCASSNYYLYQGQCIAQCPAGVTVAIGSQCVNCGGNCVTCTTSPTQCLTCNSSSYLFGNQCLTACPKGYTPSGSICSLCATSDCSTAPPNNSTNPTNSTQPTNTTVLMLVSSNDTSFNKGTVPFPFIDLTGGAIAVVGAAKIFASGVQFVPSAIAIWGVTAASSWIVTGAMIGTYDAPAPVYENVTIPKSNSTTRRSLTSLSMSGNSLIPSIVLLFLFCGAGCHVLLNVIFFGIYLFKIAKVDQTFKYWRILHKSVSIISPAVSLLVSFHFIRLFFCGLFGLEAFKARFDRRANMLRPLILLSYVSIICTSIPIIAAMAILLIHYQPSDPVWMFGLDCLIVTSLLTLVLLLDTRKMEREVVSESSEPLGIVERIHVDKAGNSQKMSELVNLFPTEDVRGALAAHRISVQKPPVKKFFGRSLSGLLSIDDLGTKKRRRFSYPLMSHEWVEIRPESLELISPKVLIEEPANEESLFQKDIDNSVQVANESTFVQPDELLLNPEVSMESEGEELLSDDRPQKVEQVSGEIVSREMGYKTPRTTLWRPLKSRIRPLPTPAPMTIVASIPDEKSAPLKVERPAKVSEALPAVEDKPLAPVKAATPVKERIVDISAETASPVPQESSSKPVSPSPKSALPEESPVHPEPEALVSDVFQKDDSPSQAHLFTRVLEQEEFHAETLNTEPAHNEEPQHEEEQQIDRLLEDLSQDFEVPESEGRLGNSQNLGIPLEETKEEVSDHIDTALFDLERAVPDATNPALVMIPHKYKGYQLKVRNEFNRARIVNLENKVIQSLPPIDERTYDMTKTIVDDTDPQFATLVSKTGESVRVKRDFGKARIVNLEKRVYHPHAFLIGQTIEREEDFQFTNAFPDPADPEVVVVMHNETGEDVRVRKSYHGAAVVDDEGRALGPTVDRNDYDIPSTVVDKEDVHVASLKHKVKRTRVKVRRDFRGAKIIDLERRKEMKTPELGGREPEEGPYDLDTSLVSQPDREHRGRGWVSPGKRSRRPNLEISEMYPSADHPENERLEHLANIIDRYDNEQESWQSASPMNHPDIDTLSSGDLTPPSKDASKKFFRKPVYHNTGLDKVYGPEARSKSGIPAFEDESVINEFVSGKRKAKRKVTPMANEKIRNMEKVYLKRMEVGKRPDTTISRALAELEDGAGQEDLLESLNARFQTERAHLTSAGEEIARGNRNRVQPFLQTPRPDDS